LAVLANNMTGTIHLCFWRWCYITAVYSLDFIHRPYVWGT
jgi:hypothetical protein